MVIDIEVVVDKFVYREQMPRSVSSNGYSVDDLNHKIVVDDERNQSVIKVDDGLDRNIFCIDRNHNVFINSIVGSCPKNIRQP
jgi:hypothetical protein